MQEQLAQEGDKAFAATQAKNTRRETGRPLSQAVPRLFCGALGARTRSNGTLHNQLHQAEMGVRATRTQGCDVRYDGSAL